MAANEAAVHVAQIAILELAQPLRPVSPEHNARNSPRRPDIAIRSLYSMALKRFGATRLENATGPRLGMSAVPELPANLMVDVFFELGKYQHMHSYLFAEMRSLQLLYKLLQYGNNRQSLVSVVSRVANDGRQLSVDIAEQYTDRADYMLTRDDRFSILLDQQHRCTRPGPERCAMDDCPGKPYTGKRDSRRITDNPSPARLSQMGLCIGSFLDDAGCWSESISILRHALRLICAQLTIAKRAKATSTVASLQLQRLHCITRLLLAESRYFDFPAAYRTHTLGTIAFAERPAETIPRPMRTAWYSAVSSQYFARSDYQQSLRWGVMAVRELNSATPDQLALDVLRQTAKACVLKRQFPRAKCLLQQAVRMARAVFGSRHYRYADVLMDYAFYLLNVDQMERAVSVYKEAMKNRLGHLGPCNLLVSLAQEDLAYALYVHHYSSGKFDSALQFVNKSIRTMSRLVGPTHLFLASAQRVKALILEEIALEEMSLQESFVEQEMAAKNPQLVEAEGLHRRALELSVLAFGEQNIQTAKHYGNLGRLYQSMTRYREAEEMHTLAIRIKTDILGPDDFEVGLSIGHLASLYNYHMDMMDEAEALYLRSISISLKLFGDSYSGLEYDYRGLLNVYEETQEVGKYNTFHALLDEWRLNRLEREDANSNVPLYDSNDHRSLEDIANEFFAISPPSTTAAPTN